MNAATDFVRQYLDQFDCENWDGRGIKSAQVRSAVWRPAVIQGADTEIAVAQVLLNGRKHTFSCWAAKAPHIGDGHIFRDASTAAPQPTLTEGA